MLGFLPALNSENRRSIEDNDGILERVIIEDIFMPEIIILLKEDKNLESNFLQKYEEVDEAINIFWHLDKLCKKAISENKNLIAIGD